MIKAILIFNNHGKPRLSKFYQRYSEDTQQQIIRETFHLVSKRDENVCNFLEGGFYSTGESVRFLEMISGWKHAGFKSESQRQKPFGAF